MKKTRTIKTKAGIDTKCLMIKHGKRQFFTEEKHYPELIEFGRKFNAEIAVVKVNEAEILLDLSTLAQCLCNPDYAPSKSEIKIEVIESKLLPIIKKIKPVDSNKQDDSIEEDAYQTLKTGEKLYLNELFNKWREDANYTTVYNKFQKAKKSLVDDGWNVQRVDRGVYLASKIE